MTVWHEFLISIKNKNTQKLSHRLFLSITSITSKFTAKLWKTCWHVVICQHCFLSLKLTCYIDPWDPFLRKHSLWRWTTESVAIRKFFIIFYYPISSESMMTFMMKSSVNVSIYAKWPLALAQRSFLTIYCSINPILIQDCTARVKTVLIYFFMT